MVTDTSLSATTGLPSDSTCRIILYYQSYWEANMTRYCVFTLQTGQIQLSPAKPNANTMLDKQAGCLPLPLLRQQPLKPPPVVYHGKTCTSRSIQLGNARSHSSRHSHTTENECFLGVNRGILTFVRFKISRWWPSSGMWRHVKFQRNIRISGVRENDIWFF
jgi:hypothetical protein